MTKKRDDQAVKIERRLATMLRVIVESENLDRTRGAQLTVAELLSTLVRKEVESMHVKALKKLATAAEPTTKAK